MMSSFRSGSLSTARVSSTIPISERNKDLPAHQRDAKVTWQYPSEQMFYNAILRKGWRVGSQPALNIHSLDDFFSSLPISLNVPRRAPHRVM
jgi:cytochrome c heme-lyase